MRIEAGCTNPQTIDVTVSITMELGRWERLYQQLDVVNWPSSDLRLHVYEILKQFRQTVIRAEEEPMPRHKPPMLRYSTVRQQLRQDRRRLCRGAAVFVAYIVTCFAVGLVLGLGLYELLKSAALFYNAR